MAGKTSSLCVRRATYWDPDMGKEDPAKKGVCSNFLCDAQAGEQVKMTGPTGKVMWAPVWRSNFRRCVCSMGISSSLVDFHAG